MKVYDLSRFRTQIMGAATIGVMLCHAVLWDDELPLLFAKALSFGNFGVDIFLLVFDMYPESWTHIYELG